MVRRVYEGLAVVVEWATAALTLGLVLLVTTNVVARYAFSSGLAWAEELSRLCFVWSVFLGAYVALRRRAHLAITALVDRLPRRPRVVVVIVGQLVVGSFLVVLVHGATELVREAFAFGTVTPILGISTAWSYLPIAVAGVLMLMEVIGELARSLAEWRPPAPLGADGEELPV